MVRERKVLCIIYDPKEGEMVRAYMLESEVDVFYAHYEALGWFNVFSFRIVRP